MAYCWDCTHFHYEKIDDEDGVGVREVKGCGKDHNYCDLEDQFQCEDFESDNFCGHC